MIHSRVALLFAMSALCAGAHAQEPFDFGRIAGLNVPPSVEINLNQAMLGFVAEASKDAGPRTAEVLAGLQSIRVKVYENVGDSLPAVLAFIDEASAALDDDGWHRTVFVQDGEDAVRVYMQLAEPEADQAASTVRGITVMVADGGGDAVFINIAGIIDPTQLGRIIGAVGMGGMLDGAGLGEPRR